MGNYMIRYYDYIYIYKYIYICVHEGNAIGHVFQWNKVAVAMMLQTMISSERLLQIVCKIIIIICMSCL